jgi:hypothetical protein
VHDPAKKTLTAHTNEAASSSSYPLFLSVPSYTPAVSNNSLADQSYAERRNALYQSFGSSKKLKVLKSQAANRVEMGSVVDGYKMMDNMDGQEQSSGNQAAIDAAKAGVVEKSVIETAMEQVS